MGKRLLEDDLIRKAQRLLKAGKLKKTEIARDCRICVDTVRRIGIGEIYPGRAYTGGKPKKIDDAKLREFLAMSPPPLVKDMAKHFGVTSATMSKAVSRMRGLV